MARQPAFVFTISALHELERSIARPLQVLSHRRLRAGGVTGMNAIDDVVMLGQAMTDLRAATCQDAVHAQEWIDVLEQNVGEPPVSAPLATNL